MGKKSKNQRRGSREEKEKPLQEEETLKEESKIEENQTQNKENEPEETTKEEQKADSNEEKPEHITEKQPEPTAEEGQDPSEPKGEPSESQAIEAQVAIAPHNEEEEDKDPLSEFYVSRKTEVDIVDFSDSFKQLTHREKMYTYYMSRAGWAGAKICFFERSYESPALFYLVTKIFILEGIQGCKERLFKAGWNETLWKDLLLYLCQFYQNCGNYLAFGAKKFIPRIPEWRFQQFINNSQLGRQHAQTTIHTWNEIVKELYATESPYGVIGLLENNGLSGYYTPGLKREEIEWLGKLMIDEGIDPINTRILKPEDKHYQIMIASSVLSMGKDRVLEIDGNKVEVCFRDFGTIITGVIDNLKLAYEFAANENQSMMIKEYIKHFTEGNMEDFKNSQKYWIKDKGPLVETNIGFIETYLDPLEVRAEWEGFVALKNKEKSELLASFVDKAETLVSKLPWGPDFEHDKFLKPDFTALDLVSMSTSMIPAGINLPNYQDIKQSEGFKNVQFENIPATSSLSALENYMTKEDALLYNEKLKPMRFARVTLHELLGHGSGKHFAEEAEGKLNFDKEKVRTPEGKEVTSWYKNGENARSVFTSHYGTIEECRAEAVSIYLACFDDVLQGLFPNIKDEKELDELRYASWLDICFSGLRGLEFYIPPVKKWGQAHMQGRFVLLNVMLQAKEGLVELKTGEDGNTRVILDRTKILTIGKKAIGEFLTVNLPF